MKAYSRQSAKHFPIGLIPRLAPKRTVCLKGQVLDIPVWKSQVLKGKDGERDGTVEDHPQGVIKCLPAGDWAAAGKMSLRGRRTPGTLTAFTNC